MYCSNCGREYEGNFCPYCGTSSRNAELKSENTEQDIPVVKYNQKESVPTLPKDTVNKSVLPCMIISEVLDGDEDWFLYYILSYVIIGITYLLYTFFVSIPMVHLWNGQLQSADIKGILWMHIISFIGVTAMSWVRHQLEYSFLNLMNDLYKKASIFEQHGGNSEDFIRAWVKEITKIIKRANEYANPIIFVWVVIIVDAILIWRVLY